MRAPRVQLWTAPGRLHRTCTIRAFIITSVHVPPYRRDILGREPCAGTARGNTRFHRLICLALALHRMRLPDRTPAMTQQRCCFCATCSVAPVSLSGHRRRARTRVCRDEGAEDMGIQPTSHIPHLLVKDLRCLGIPGLCARCRTRAARPGEWHLRGSETVILPVTRCSSHTALCCVPGTVLGLHETAKAAAVPSVFLNLGSDLQ